MAEGFVPLKAEDLKNPQGVTVLNNMLSFLFDNVAGDGETRRIFSGQGTPEGQISADVGSLFLRTDGGSGTTVYAKESGSGNTGWSAL